MTLYAQWVRQYSIYYYANGGSGAPSTQTEDVDKTVALSSTKPTKSAATTSYTVTYNKVNEDATLSKSSDTVSSTKTFTFSHWNTRSDGTGTNYLPGQSFKIPASDTYLYAIYTEYISGSTTLPTGSLTQYTLSGFSESLEDIIYVSNPYVPTKNITLYAIWSPASSGGYIKFASASGLDNIGEGSRIYIEGFHNPENDGPYTVASYSYSGGYIEMNFVEDFAFDGSQNAEYETLYIYGNGNRVPDLDYICALNNRLWGCSSKLRTIYASALGDPTDFWTFAGDALDAFQAAVGSGGDFTGCAAMNNNVLFFKQHTIHKILGNFPAEYQLYTYDLDGTSQSNGLSAINCDGTIIFVTEHGIGTYSGSTAGQLSKELGEGNMHNAIAMFNGEQYYLHFTDDNNHRRTYIFDTRYNLWVEADYKEVLAFAHMKDVDYVLSRDGDDSGVYQIDSKEPYDGDWEILYKPFYEQTTGRYGSSSHVFETKRYTGLTFRIELPLNSWIKAEIKSDDGRWIPVARKAGTQNHVQEFVIRTPRTDKIQLRLSGHGPMTILSMEREYTIGSRR